MNYAFSYLLTPLSWIPPGAALNLNSDNGNTLGHYLSAVNYISSLHLTDYLSAITYFIYSMEKARSIL